MPDRAVLFVDGNNWYHSLKALRLNDLGHLDYAKVSRKLVGPRDWIGTRYYIGQVQQRRDVRLYAEQRRFLARLAATDHRITSHLGRLETRSVKNEAAAEVRKYLSSLQTQIDRTVFQELMALARRYETTKVLVEKAVDVMLAVDVVAMAERDEYDTAYILSADGDYTPAAEAARSLQKKVFAVSPNPGAQLAAAVDAFIRIPREWFDDCYNT